METQEMKTTTFSNMKDEFIGEAGTPRDEYELPMEIPERIIKAARRDRLLTQEQLGKPIGVRKAQISKLENEFVKLAK